MAMHGDVLLCEHVSFLKNFSERDSFFFPVAFAIAPRPIGESFFFLDRGNQDPPLSFFKMCGPFSFPGKKAVSFFSPSLR